MEPGLAAHSASAAASAASAALAGEMSPLSLFFQAGAVVKGVILLLIAASIWSWAIIIEKAMLIRRIRRAAGKFEANFWSGGSLEQLYNRLGSRARDPMTATFIAGMKEWKATVARGLPETGELRAGLLQRVERMMDLVIDREMSQAERRMIFLASVGATAPFVGLFGTIWGIMNSFAAIAQTQNTSLAVVAPGIAEALFATALGLFAAIPAVVAYNKFAGDFGSFSERLEGFAGELAAILGRHMEERAQARPDEQAA